MTPFRRHEGVAAPLARANIDTDAIAPMRFLITTERKGMGRALFANWRDEDPDFVLSKAPWRDASILVAGPNFGCGSSREMAVWALADAGFRAVVAPSFGDIFETNCFKNGLLALALPEATVRDLLGQLARGEGGGRMAIDLEACRLTQPNGSVVGFAIETMRREALLEGLDDIELTLKREADIAAFQARDRLRRPWVYDVD